MACARPFGPKRTGTPALFSSAWSLAHCRLRSLWSQLERAGPVVRGSSPPESRSSASLTSIEASLTFAQRTSPTLHRGNARAILKRSPGGITPERSSLCLQVLSEDLAWLTLTLSPLSLLPLSPVSLRSPLRPSVCLRFSECVGSCSVRLFAE